MKFDVFTEYEEETPGQLCKTIDDYGHNDCFFNWNSTLIADMTADYNITIDENITVGAEFNILGLDFGFSCDACGEIACMIEFPFGVEIPNIGSSFTFPIVECGTTFANVFEVAQFDFSPFIVSNPLDALLPFPIKIPVVGSMYMQHNNGTVILKVDFDISIK